MVLPHIARYFGLLTVLMVAQTGCVGPVADENTRIATAQLQVAGASETATWTCTGTPCPWGDTLSGEAIVWSADLGPTFTRLGYTLSDGVYLPSASANGVTVTIVTGSATAYAGLPNADSFRSLGMIGAGQSLVITGLAAGEIMSVQGDSAFTYELDLPDAVPPPPVDGGTGDDGEWPSPTTEAAAELVTWSCTGSPCPWGPSDNNYTLVWPAAAEPLSNRLGYTTSAPAYLPADAANGMTVWIDSGSATAYAGLPDASSHRVLATIPAGGSYTVSGLAAGEVLSVQSGSVFTHHLTFSTPPDGGGGGPESEADFATWTCTSTPCPWGSSTTGYALAWPDDWQPSNLRLGYTVSADIYLPSAMANGAIVSLVGGTATVYAGLPNAGSHRALATIGAGQSYTIAGTTTGEVVSVQSDSLFTYTVTPTTTPPPPPPTDAIDADPAFWRCTAPGCADPDWTGAVISWPSWSAYQTNARAGGDSRAVYSADGEPLYPYMGSWANGCKVTAVSGLVLIIEWERGTNEWTEIVLEPGETHTITLTPPQNGAMIETFDGLFSFSVTLENCTPQPLAVTNPPTATATAGDQQVTVEWPSVSGATGYNLYWGTSPGVTNGSASVLDVSSPYVHTGLSSGTTYYYRVTAMTADGETAQSAEVSATPFVSAPSAPTGVTATPGNAEVSVAWTAVSGATSYNIYWATSSGVTTGSSKITGASSPYLHTGRTNGTTYYYRVTAVSAGGESPLSSEVSARPVLPAPSAPTGGSATPANGQVTVVWTAVSGATSYNLYWGTSPGVTTGSTKITGATSPYVHTGRTNGTTYYYRVSAVNTGGESALSAEMNARPLAPPTVPSGLTATVGNGQVTLAWTAVSGATSYNLYWSTSAGVTTGSSKITGATSPYVHTGRTNGTTYYYRVSAVNAGGESGLSSEVNARPAAPPSAPTGVTATAGNGQVTVAWTAVSGATSYNLYWGTSPGVTVGSTKITGATSPYVHTGRTNGTTYYYRVTAVNTGGESTLSAEVNARPLAPPTVPNGLTATAGNGQVTLAWTPVSGATSYNVYWGPLSGLTIIKISGVTNPYVHVGRTNGTTYYYRVSAVNAAGESGLSSEVNARPAAPPSAPTGVSATPANGQVTIAWTAVSGATSYNVYWGTSPGVTTGSAKITGASRPYVHTGRTNGTTYYYRVSAVNSGGESALSAEVNARPVAPPSAPTGVTATAGNRSVTVNWSSVSGATSYNIYWGTSPGVTTGSAKITGATRPYLHTGRSSSTRYYYRVTAVNGSGESALSSEVNARAN